jgi:hypothetical protein
VDTTGLKGFDSGDTQPVSGGLSEPPAESTGLAEPPKEGELAAPPAAEPAPQVAAAKAEPVAKAAIPKPAPAVDKVAAQRVDIPTWFWIFGGILLAIIAITSYVMTWERPRGLQDAAVVVLPARGADPRRAGIDRLRLRDTVGSRGRGRLRRAAARARLSLHQPPARGGERARRGP